MIQWGATRRLARRYPRTTAGVVLANLLVLLGVVAFSWSVGIVLVVYWLETGVALLAAIAAALLANEVGDVDEQHHDQVEAIDPNRRIELRPGWPGLRVRNAAVVVPMGFLFGFFWVVHGVFVWAFARCCPTAERFRSTTGSSSRSSAWWSPGRRSSTPNRSSRSATALRLRRDSSRRCSAGSSRCTSH